MFRYFDIHTHRTYTDSGVVVVVNKRLFYDLDPKPTSGLFTIGIHPYDASRAIGDWSDELTSIAKQPNCIAIGEVGIDKRMGDVDMQTEILKTQIQIALQLQKPIIIHCVKAESEILKLTQGLPVPVIFHSYPKYGAQIASCDNTLFSLSDRNITHPDVVKIPTSKILFETDDQSVSIKDVYHHYCSTLGLDIDQIGVQIENNFHKTFNINGTEMERADGVVARQEKY